MDRKIQCNELPGFIIKYRFGALYKKPTGIIGLINDGHHLAFEPVEIHGVLKLS
jgi:hypothetical protein